MDSLIHKHHKVKLFKDLRYSNPQFRQSLLQPDQIENVNKIYNTMKKKLNIQQMKVEVDIKTFRKQQSVKNIDMSIEEKIIKYKKDKQDKRIHQKMKIFQKKKQKKRIAIYQTPMKQLMQSFQKQKKIDQSSSYLADLRQSERQLIYVKSNSGRKRKFQPALDQEFSKNRVISMENGLPKQIQQHFIPLEQRMNHAKVRQIHNTNHSIDQLERSLDKIYQQDHHKQPYARHLHTQIKNATLIQKMRQKKLFDRAKSNFNRSIDSSKKIISTLTRYIDAKKRKKVQYCQLISTWKLDRPITSELRRQNYTILGEKNEKQLQEYRNLTQKKRQNLLKLNNQFYNQLVEFIIYQCKPHENIEFTKFICQKIRKKLETHQKINIDFIQDCLIEGKIKNLSEDRIVPQILSKLQNFIKNTQLQQNRFQV